MKAILAQPVALDTGGDVPRPHRAVTRGQDYAGSVLLRTARLCLRELRLADVPDLSALHHAPLVGAVALRPLPSAFLEIAGIVIQSNRTDNAQPGLGRWRADDQQSRFAALLSLLPLANTPDVELGAMLMPGACGLSLAIEGARALRDHAFVALDVSRLVAFCRVDNAAASVILRRLGFILVDPSEAAEHAHQMFAIERNAWASCGRRRTR